VINKIAATAPRFLPRSLLRSMVAAVGSNLPLLPTERLSASNGSCR
jgi:hypothetical protein